MSSTSAVQPCDFVCIVRFVQHLGVEPADHIAATVLNQRVLLASSANIKCCVPKQRSIRSNLPVSGSYIVGLPRVLLSSGKSFAEGLSPPACRRRAFAGARMVAAVQMRPFASIIRLWTLALLFQMGSSPQ